MSMERILLENLKGRSRCLDLEQGSRTEIVGGPGLQFLNLRLSPHNFKQQGGHLYSLKLNAPLRVRHTFNAMKNRNSYSI